MENNVIYVVKYAKYCDYNDNPMYEYYPFSDYTFAKEFAIYCFNEYVKNNKDSYSDEKIGIERAALENFDKIPYLIHIEKRALNTCSPL